MKLVYGNSKAEPAVAIKDDDDKLLATVCSNGTVNYEDGFNPPPTIKESLEIIARKVPVACVCLKEVERHLKELITVNRELINGQF